MLAFLAILTVTIALWTIAQGANLFTVFMYSDSEAAVTNADVTASNDEILSTRNNHLIITDPLIAIAIHGQGSLLSRLRFNNSQLIQYAVPHVWPLSVSATIEDQPPVMDLRDRPLKIPLNEEIVMEGTTTAAGPSRIEAALFLAHPSWNRNLSPYIWQGVIRGTVVIAAGAEGAWTALANPVFERDPYGGVYEVYGMELVAANAIAFRLRFNEQPTVRGRQFRPGGLVQDAANLEPWKVQRGELGGLGVWGRWHTFTPPQIQVFGDAAGGTYEFRMHCGMVSEDRNAVFATPGGVA